MSFKINKMDEYTMTAGNRKQLGNVLLVSMSVHF